MFYTVTLPCTLWFLDKGKHGTPAPIKCSSSTPVTSTARSTEPTAIGPTRRSAFWPTSSASTAAKNSDFTLGGEEAKAKILEVFAAKAKSEIENLKYRDVPGLCKVATLKEIETQGWSLNPGRYVGVAPGESVSDEDFKEQLEEMNEELEKLNAQARELEETSHGMWRRY